jgi:transposase
VATKEIKLQLKPDPRAKLLMTLPAVGHLTAYLLLNEIGDVKRFSTPGKLSACGGIVPIIRQSADHRWQCHINGRGCQTNGRMLIHHFALATHRSS